MHISIHNVGKRFESKYVFKGLSREINSGERLGIVGRNGSGKSTLVQIISGYLPASEGSVKYNGEINELVWKNISWVSPALGLYESFTLKEHLEFVFSLRKPLSGLGTDSMISAMELTAHAHKQIRFFSSGMKQRVKLGVGFFCESDLLLLDEPCAHLDRHAEEWYSQLFLDYAGNRTVLIASNANEAELLHAGSIWNLPTL